MQEQPQAQSPLIAIAKERAMLRIVRYVAVAVLVLAAVPSFATAAESFKDVIVKNTPAEAVPVKGVGTQLVQGTVEVSNLPATQKVEGTVEIANLPGSQELRSGGGYVMRGPGGDVLLPDDIALTDLVITLIHSQAGSCEVALYEDPGVGDLQSIVGFYPTTEDRTEQLHLESGLLPRPGWGVTVNSDCVLQVFWSGYIVP